MDRSRKPFWNVNYENNDITEDLKESLVSISYIDHLDSLSDDLQIVTGDSFENWISNWYPKKSDKVSFSFGYDNEVVVSSGELEVDEVEFSGPPNIAVVKALGTGVGTSLRTKIYYAYENMNLSDIVSTVAARHNLRLEGINGGFEINRVTQNNETDLAFLLRISSDYGYSFSIRGDVLCFYELKSLFEQSPAFEITKKNITAYKIKDGIVKYPFKATLSYFDQESGELIKADSSNDSDSRDEIFINDRVSSIEMAKSATESKLLRARMKSKSGSIEMPGENSLLSGSTVRLSGFGNLDGNYLITKSIHHINRESGYKTYIDISR